MPKTIALIVAAGSGSRLGGDVAKPYIKLAGKAVLRRTVEAFLAHPRIDGVRVVISREHHMLYRKTMDGLTTFPCVIGGATRQDSVRRGLESIARAKPELVLIHDAARPLVSAELIDRVLDGLKTHAAVLPSVAVADTLRRGHALVDREGLHAAQTPQGFQFDVILKAHRMFREPVTDDIALAEKAGFTVGLVHGERSNIKLTTPDDLLMMEKLAQTPFETRVGMGFDVHNFIPHDASKPENQQAISLCGIKVPHGMKLQGNSDADVGLHALVDALLGAIGAGDIGTHFPPDDPKWAGADSSRFLIHAFELVKKRGGEIVHIDITIIGERPKVGPHREAMQARISDILKLDVSRISIKATTTEKLGFLGRGEGLAAQAVATVKLPA